MSETRFYTPPIPDPAKASEGTFVPNRMENDAIMRRVSRDMYASPTAGIREIVANEITAARAAKKLGANPRIEVTILPDRVCVWGMDSLGMERRIFDDVFTVLGRSGNFDGKTPGQFGFGRAAYMTISDHMLLETRHRNGDKYTVLGVEGRGFQVDIGEPDIPFGTRITMAPRAGVNARALADMVRSIAGRCEIPLTMVTVNGSEEPERRRLEFSGLYLDADLPDVEFSVGPNYSVNYKSYLCGMPIGFRYRGSYSIGVVVDIHDERKHPPTPDRERMAEESETAISKIIDAEIRRRLEAFPTDINEALAHPDRRLAHLLNRPPDAMYDTYEMYSRRGRHFKGLVDADGPPILGCKTFARNRMRAVLSRFPDAVFVKNPPEGLTTLSDFMKEHGIRPLPAKRRDAPKPRPKKDAVLHTSGGRKNVDPNDPPADLTILRVAGTAEVKKYSGLVRHLGVALTIHDVRGAVPVDDFTADARRHAFETSGGMMTGEQLLENRGYVHRTGTRRLLDLVGNAEQDVGGPAVRGILVHDDGTEAHRKAYSILGAMSSWLDSGFGCHEWGGETGVETYLRLESPMLRRVMRELPDSRTESFCRDFLASEGKELLPP